MTAHRLPPLAQQAANALQLMDDGCVRMPADVLHQLKCSLDVMKPPQRDEEVRGLLVVASRLSQGNIEVIADGFAQLALLVTVANAGKHASKLAPQKNRRR